MGILDIWKTDTAVYAMPYDDTMDFAHIGKIDVDTVEYSTLDREVTIHGTIPYIPYDKIFAITNVPREYRIKNVIFNGPATIVFWADDTKTVVKCQDGDEFDAEKAIAMCYVKKIHSNKSRFNNYIKKWLPKEEA